VAPQLFTSVKAARIAIEDRGSPVVVVPVYNGYDDVVRCLESLFVHTPEDADILVVDDVGADRRIFDLLSGYLNRPGPRVSILQRSENGGFIGACNSAFDAAGSRDVILVNSDVVVAAEWYTRLTAAAQSSNVIATASALTNHGTILSVPVRNHASPMVPGNLTVEEVSDRIAKRSLRLRPSIPTAVGHCTYVKRAALNRVGKFDVIFGRGYGEEVDFSQRAVRAGFRHVCADDVFVYHRGGGSFGDERGELQQKNEKILAARYPYYPTAGRVAADDVTSSLALALRNASIAINGLTIAIDGSCLGPDYMGTQHVVVETVRSLAAKMSVSQIHVYVPPSISDETRSKIEGLSSVTIHSVNEHVAVKADVAYRPYQLTNPDELNRLRSWGQWTAVNQLDVIAFHNPAYFPSAHEWIRYREMTRLILHSVDGVAFISDHARREVNAELLVGGNAAQKTIFCGSDFGDAAHSMRPKQLVNDASFVFALGASYLHKGRSFSMRVLQGLIDRGWDGCLVLAGPTPPNGNSLGEEAELILRDPRLKDRVTVLGSITDAEKRWLFENTRLFLYPSVVEGFGFMPFEAAHHGVASICSRGGSLDEVLPVDLPCIPDFDVDAAVDLAWRVLQDDALGEQMVHTVRSGGAQFTWERTTDLLLELIQEMTTRRPSISLSVVGERLNALDLHVREVRAADSSPGAPSLGQRHPMVKRVFSPEGSRRQRAARRLINKLRRARARLR